jgi:hypothetical protein
MFDMVLMYRKPRVKKCQEMLLGESWLFTAIWFFFLIFPRHKVLIWLSEEAAVINTMLINPQTNPLVTRKDAASYTSDIGTVAAERLTQNVLIEVIPSSNWDFYRI